MTILPFLAPLSILSRTETSFIRVHFSSGVMYVMHFLHGNDTAPPMIAALTYSTPADFMLAIERERVLSMPITSYLYFGGYHK
jgi:hypothetical protein